MSDDSRKMYDFDEDFNVDEENHSNKDRGQHDKV